MLNRALIGIIYHSGSGYARTITFYVQCFTSNTIPLNLGYEPGKSTFSNTVSHKHGTIRHVTLLSKTHAQVECFTFFL